MKTQRGFTLIELLTVMLMMGLVASVMLYNFRQGDRQKRINLARDSVILALRTAQNYTLAGKLIPPPAFAPHVRGNARCASDNSPVSYWVEFNTSTTYNLMVEDNCGAVMRVQQFSLVQSTGFLTSAQPFSLANGSGTTNASNLSVRFSAPFAVMTGTTAANPLPANFGSFATTTARIQTQDGSRTLDVVIDGISGKIE
ncbi:MAG TPA: type II secretion system protein [Candidatus Binatia bacterium]|nr:type II secretion system protein [Candidatus Binatia bacterium]